jgi:hypothetical protein
MDIDDYGRTYELQEMAYPDLLEALNNEHCTYNFLC